MYNAVVNFCPHCPKCWLSKLMRMILHCSVRMANLSRQAALVAACQTQTLRSDKDSFLDQTLDRLRWALFQLGPVLGHVVKSKNPTQFKQNPPNLGIWRPSITAGFLILNRPPRDIWPPWLNWFSQNTPYRCSLLGIFHPLTPPNCSLAVSSHFFFFCCIWSWAWSRSPATKPLCSSPYTSITTVPWTVYLAILTSVTNNFLTSIIPQLTKTTDMHTVQILPVFYYYNYCIICRITF